MEEYGTIRIKLDELIRKSGISKNKLSHRAEMQRTQINNYCNNEITRLDIDVLARICTVFDCEIGDLLEFIPPEKYVALLRPPGRSFFISYWNFQKIHCNSPGDLIY